MFIEERIEALHLRVEQLETHKAEIEAAMREQEHRIRNELMKISARTGYSVAELAKLLEAVAANLYANQTPLPAPKGSAQDDGEPTTTGPIPPAQNEVALAGPPAEASVQAENGGSGSDQVVAPPVEAPASPAVDEDESKPEKGWDSYIRVVGRVVYAPRAELYVTTQQAQIVQALLHGPKTIDELSAAQGEKVNRMTVMRLGNMTSTLRDGGLKIVCINGKYWLRPDNSRKGK